MPHADAAHRHIVERIRYYARRRHWSGNQVADFAGISRAQISRVLTMKQSPSVATLVKIATALDVGLRDLVPP